MKKLFDHIEHLKGKPHHIRKQVSYGVAGTGTALIALVWFVSSISTGAFAIQGSSFADSVRQGAVLVANPDNANGDDNLAGAAAAFSEGPAVAPRIEIVAAPVATSSTVQREQTTIPF